MGKVKHNNLFRSHADKRDVYDTLQADYDRDTTRHGWWHVALIGAATGAGFSYGPEVLWFFAGTYAIERALCRFIDNSNRNWAMHVIDWIEQKD